MGGKRKTLPRNPGDVWSDVAWQLDVREPIKAESRKEELTVGLIDRVTAMWREARLTSTYEISDSVQRGLRLRVQPRGPTYFARVQYKGKEFRTRIGRVDAWGLAHVDRP